MRMTEEEKRRYHIEAVRRWRKKHPEKAAEYQRAYRKRHPAKVKEINEETKKKRHVGKPKFDRSAFMKEYWRKKRGKKALEQEYDDRKALEQEYDDRKIDLEFYIRERSIILQKMKKYDKKTRENKSPFANEHYSI